jgi:hypothetical protein
MKDWERIRLQRRDITDYLVHLTKIGRSFVKEGEHVRIAEGQPTRDAKDVLLNILRTGVFLPGRGFAFSLSVSQWRETIHGPQGAVCFTEVPLGSIVEGPGFGERFSWYGLAFHRVDLYRMGARNVIYDDNKCLAELPDSLKYRWVRFEPKALGEEGYPCDFAHEREWRLPVHKSMPLQRIVRRPPEIPAFRIIVHRDKEVTELRGFLKALAAEAAANTFHALVQGAQIISVETVRQRIKQGEQAYERIDTLPIGHDVAELAQ